MKESEKDLPLRPWTPWKPRESHGPIVHVAILIDYSNIIQEPSYTMSSIMAIIDQLLEQTLNNDRSYVFDVRLYDGWDELVVMEDGNSSSVESKLSKHAEDVLRNLEGTAVRHRVRHIVRVSIARSLCSIPQLAFIGTYRRKQISYKLVLDGRSKVCCDGARACYDYLHSLIKQKRCCYCNAEVRYVSSSEQKLIDSMICVDAITMAGDKQSILVLASDDDDFMPVIFHIVANGQQLIHVRKRLTPTYVRYVQDAERHVSDFSSYYKVVQL